MFLEWIALPGVAVLLLIGMLALQEFGRRRARQQLDAASPPTDAGTSAIDAAVFALLGLLLAFQFGGAAARLDARRALLVREGNAIGTAYLRLDLLSPEDQTPLRELFRSYLDARIGAYRAMPHADKVRDEQREAGRLQAEIWARAVKACDAKPGTGVNVLLIPALNETFDAATARDTATMTHGSVVISGFLIGVCLLAGYLSGRATAASAKRPLIHVVAFAVLISATVYLILDLEYPRIGLLRVGAADQVMVDLRASMR